jgi:hypothetical protein
MHDFYGLFLGIDGVQRLLSAAPAPSSLQYSPKSGSTTRGAFLLSFVTFAGPPPHRPRHTTSFARGATKRTVFKYGNAAGRNDDFPPGLRRQTGARPVVGKTPPHIQR